MIASSTGRPSLFREEYVTQATKLYNLGATDSDVADFFQVTEKTINRWKHDYPAFADAMRLAKEEADKRVEQSLYRRALGFEHDAVKIFMPAGATEPVYAHYRNIVPPDTTACIFWLKNRKPTEWRDKTTQEFTGANGNPLELVVRRVDQEVSPHQLANMVEGTLKVVDEREQPRVLPESIPKCSKD